jgi:protein-tyrosine-phosphatase
MKARWKMKPEDVTEEDVDAVEMILGMGCGAWAMVSPRAIIAASVVAIANRRDESEATDDPE